MICAAKKSISANTVNTFMVCDCDVCRLTLSGHKQHLLFIRTSFEVFHLHVAGEHSTVQSLTRKKYTPMFYLSVSAAS